MIDALVRCYNCPPEGATVGRLCLVLSIKHYKYSLFVLVLKKEEEEACDLIQQKSFYCRSSAKCVGDRELLWQPDPGSQGQSDLQQRGESSSRELHLVQE